MISEQVFRIKKNDKPYWNCYCRHFELIENYDKAIADGTLLWACHHRLETHNSDGERRIVDLSKEELIALGMYYDRPAEELIFLTPADHNKLHTIGKNLSEETKRKMSKAHKGKLINRKDLSKKVLCVETGIVFESTMDAYRKTGINRGNICQACNGKFQTIGGYHWKFV